MSKQKFNGSCAFDGIIKVNVAGQEYSLETDLGGLALRKADPEKEVMMLIASHCPYNEVDTGFVIAVSGSPYRFGLKVRNDSDFYGIYSFADVVAWGYVDGSPRV